ASDTKKGGSRHTSVFSIEKEGAGQVAVIGPPNSGKSSLVTALTNASPEISSAPFTTWAPTPGMMNYRHVPVQLIDTPPLDSSYVEPAFIDLLRRCDLLLLVIDLQTDPAAQLEQSLELLAQYHVRQLQSDEVIDAVPRLACKRILFIANKCDDDGDDEILDIARELVGVECELLPASAKTGRNLDNLQEAIIQSLQLMRVYSKPPGEEVDFDAPFVLRQGSTIEEFAAQVHRDFYDQLKSARIWGSGAFDGQEVSRDYILHDGDIVELRI
ncbi:MAG: GTPase, partial [Candidatus Promineifilaceae bacterium]